MHPWWLNGLTLGLAIVATDRVLCRLNLHRHCHPQPRAKQGPTCGHHVCTPACRHRGMHVVRCPCHVEISTRTLAQLSEDADPAG